METDDTSKQFVPENLIIDKRAISKDLTKRLLDSIPDTPVHILNDFIDGHSPFGSILPQSRSSKKAIWLITINKGPFVKSCPGTTHAICCNYSVINSITGCPMDCSYCILQGYLNSPYIKIYANTEGLFSEIDGFIQKKKGVICRIGTGELADSLALDPFTRQAESLISFFSQKNDALFELKTKSASVDHLLDLPHGARTVISWSLNTERLIREEEKDAAPLDERLAAAARCQKAGYPIGLHFDPMIFYTGWEEDYHQLVRKTFHYIDPGGVIWVSLGSLRYPPSLQAVIEKRWPDSRIFLGESFPGLDGKIRYIKALRIEMYRKMVESLRSYNSDFFIYLCMETKEVWKRVFGWSPSSNRELELAFDRDIRIFLKEWTRCNDLG